MLLFLSSIFFFFFFQRIFLESKEKYALQVFQFALQLPRADVDVPVGLERTELLPIADYNGR